MELQRLNISSTGNTPTPKQCIVSGCGGIAQPIYIPFVNSWVQPNKCKACVAKEAAEADARQERQRYQGAMEVLNLPPRFHSASFKNFRSELQETAFRVASGFAEEYTLNTRRGLYLFGHAGSGKTHLAAAIANALVLKTEVRFVTAPELLLEIRKTFNTQGDTGLLDKLSKTKLLIIDDLGSEKPTEWVQETLFVLIDRRYTHLLPTVITSNYSLDQLKERLGYRIASRIAEMSTMVELRGNDYRIRKAA